MCTMYSSKVVALFVANCVFLIANIWIIQYNPDSGTNDHESLTPEQEVAAFRTFKHIEDSQINPVSAEDVVQQTGNRRRAKIVSEKSRQKNAEIANSINKTKLADEFTEKVVAGYTRGTDSNVISEADSIKFADLRQAYFVPWIFTTNLVNCPLMLGGDRSEINRAKTLMEQRQHTKVPIYEEAYDEWTSDCASFISERGYITIPLSQEEEEYPLAFSIAMYTDVEQTERLLRMIYQPQNLYCIHIDTKTSLLIHRTVRRIAACFNNVFVAEHIDKIKWGDDSILFPALNCMRHLMKYHRGKWNYFINLTGQEMPLRTNLELVKIAKIFNGSNDIAGSKPRMESDRVLYRWTHRWSRTYQQTIFYKTDEKLEENPDKLTFYKGELHGFFSHNMVHYIVSDPVSQRYLAWCHDTGHPSEHYWNVLNYNQQLHAPGGYIGSDDIAHTYSLEPIMRAKHWVQVNYGNRKCGGEVVRGICVYGVTDLPWLHKRPELAANKFRMSLEYLAYDCLEQRHRNRTRGMRVGHDFNETLYKNLPTVLYSRKDGIPPKQTIK